ncbi:MAG: hypothetical protein K0S45_1830 [Nitrospira sp.]|jgi:hypothetical protein|nr:hypothetical protein [Nitrospira sp.]
MPFRKIPDDVRRFIQANIDSIAHLEALLLVHEQPDVEWTVADMSARLYISPKETSAILLRLRADRLVEVKGNDDARFQYQPGSDELSGMVDRLADSYAKHLVPITGLIHSKQGSRIREFPDAFDFRKERP